MTEAQKNALREAIVHVERDMETMTGEWSDTYGEVVSAAKKYLAIWTFDAETRNKPADTFRTASAQRGLVDILKEICGQGYLDTYMRDRVKEALAAHEKAGKI